MISVDEIQHEIWLEFEQLASYDAHIIVSNREAKDYLGVKYDDMVTLDGDYANLPYIDRKINGLINNLPSQIKWDEILKLYPQANYNAIDPWQRDWEEKRKMLHSVFFDNEMANKYFVDKVHGGHVCCPKCGRPNPYKLSSGAFKCRSVPCGSKFSALTGTMFENTKLPLRVWYGMIYLMTSVHKDRISNWAAARSLNVTQKTGWGMAKKIKNNYGSETLKFINKGLFEYK